MNETFSHSLGHKQAVAKGSNRASEYDLMTGPAHAKTSRPEMSRPMTYQTERSEIFAAVLSSDTDRLRASIARGADPNSLDALGATPLYYAITRGDAETVEALLDAGADTELPTDSDDASLTPLRLAEEFWGLIEIGALLRARGAKEWESSPTPQPGRTWFKRLFRPGAK